MPRLIDFLERSLVLLLYAAMVVRFAPVALVHPQYLLLLVSELLIVIFIVIRKPGAMSLAPYAFLVAMIGTTAPLLAHPAGDPMAPDWLTTAIMSVGLLINISAKLSLNRSFGMVAANRGVKRGGAYRVVRHPMYIGYMLTQFGFMLGNPSMWNLAVYVVAWSVQLLRIKEEERFLSADPEYAAYSSKVRWRLLPGAF